jgi:tetratricopeptide (TPR) repeat protein
MSTPASLQAVDHAYAEQHRWKSAETALLQAIDLAPKSWAAHQGAASFYYSRADYAKSRRHYQEVVRLTPDNGQALNALGYLEYLGGDIAAAVASYAKSADLGERRNPCPQKAKSGQTTPAQSRLFVQFLPLSNLGELYLESRDYERAEQYLQASIRCNENWHTPWGLLGETYLARGRGESARLYFLKAKEHALSYLEVTSRNAATTAYLAGFLARLGETRAAETQLQRALDIRSDNPRTLARCGEVLFMLGRQGEAETLLARAVKAGFPLRVLRLKPGLVNLRDQDWSRIVGAAPSADRFPQALCAARLARTSSIA